MRCCFPAATDTRRKDPGFQRGSGKRGPSWSYRNRPPGRPRPAVEKPASREQDLMIHKPVAQENIVRFGVRPNPLHQRIVSVLKLDEVAVVDREQVDRAPHENRHGQAERGEAAKRNEPARPDMPEPPETVGGEQVADDQPEIEKLMVRQSFQAQFEAKGHEEHRAKSEEEPAMKPGDANQGDQDEQPFQAKGKSDVAQDVIYGGGIDDVAPMQDGTSGC